MAGAISVGLAGGTETMTMIPMGGNKIVPNIRMAETFPQAYVGMGETAENVAMKYGITRKEQDEFALESNNRALAANKNGNFKEQIVPLPAYRFDGKGNKIDFTYEVDEGPRPSTIEGIAGLRPAFCNPKAKTPEKLRDGSAVHEKGRIGTVTAANASQMSDGAGALLVMDIDKAKELGCTPMAKLHGYRVVAFDPDYMGIGPALAIPAVMETFGKPLGLTLDDIDVFELNEAFASQAVYCARELGLMDAWKAGKVNPNGGAIALGHPLGATGAKLSTQIIYHMIDNNLKWGIVSMCIGGGMGAAGLFENLQYKG
jgi:acetyl-CoA acyltransferase